MHKYKVEYHTPIIVGLLFYLPVLLVTRYTQNTPNIKTMLSTGMHRSAKFQTPPNAVDLL